MKNIVQKRRSGKIHLFLFLFFFLNLFFPLHSQERLRKSPPYPEPLKELILPNIESYPLSNGLKIAFIRRENLPIISMQLIILTGESSSPDNKPGLATFTANMFSKGTTDLSSSDIEEIVESIGGNISTSTFLDYSVFAFSFLDEYLDEALDILSQMILKPTFLKREIDNEKRNMYYDLREKVNDPEFIAKRQFFQILFRDHPYKKIAFSEDYIKYITQNDIFTFFNEYYKPNNAILLLIGNLNLNTAFRKASHYLNTWKNSNGDRSFVPAPESNSKKRICLVDLPQARDSTIYIGNVVCPRTIQDFYPLVVLNQVLGGTTSSRLFMNLRETKGYAYYAFSKVELFKSCGVFIIRTKVRPEVTYFSVIESLNEIEKMIKEEVSSFEIEQAKSYLIGNFPLKLENLEDFYSNFSRVIALNHGNDYWNKYYENIMLINAEKVYEAAQKYPIVTSLVVIVADKNKIIEYLKDFEEVEVYDTQGNLQYTISQGVKE